MVLGILKVLLLALFALFVISAWFWPKRLVGTMVAEIHNLPEGYPLKDFTAKWMESGCWIWFARILSIPILFLLNTTGIFRKIIETYTKRKVD